MAGTQELADRIDAALASIEQRREQFRVMFHCEVCDEEDDTTHSVLLRICGVCAQTLRERNQQTATGPRS